MENSSTQPATTQVSQGLVDCTYLTERPSTILIWQDLLQVSIPKDMKKRGIKAQLNGISERSLNNLRRLLAMVNFKRCHFVTLTYHELIPSSAQVKRDIDAFGKRLHRAFPDVSFVWRMELTQKGKWHVHMFIYDLPYLRSKARDALRTNFRYANFNAELERARKSLAVVKNREYRQIDWFKSELAFYRLWFSFCWHDVTGEKSKAHLVGGTNVKRCPTNRRVQWYVTKYISKHDERHIRGRFGRLWGRSKNLKCKPSVKIELERHEAIIIRDYLIAVLNSRDEKSASYADKLKENAEKWGVLGMSLIGLGMQSYDGSTYRNIKAILDELRTSPDIHIVQRE